MEMFGREVPQTAFNFVTTFRFEEEQAMSDLRNYSLDELREIKELTDHIVANLHAIQGDNNDVAGCKIRLQASLPTCMPLRKTRTILKNWSVRLQSSWQI
jgi:hypothetical protein